ncbi:VanZ family protein [Hydrogenophaga sp.]|uniref:VanZ family protein n=1 Tax=Hydrogenophaga sp. TaxID=1904254 RepID=UPI0025BBFCE0|nr:VanZ family protein [Hydrogenophaga sp.]MBT9463088.1 VanZ family protein [Hydrogenophaga sp.]
MVFSLGRVQRIARWLAVLLALSIPLALWVGGAQPFAVGLVPAPWDKLAHMAVYAVLSCAIGFASRRHGPSAMLFGFAGALLVGLVDEASQMRLPGRTAEIDDLVADAAGAALGTVVLAVRMQLRAWVAAHVEVERH